ncbi:MAG TPA: D-alanyl-D-alanine carboxypeptidase/D-alanyl-D-alanine-endopeptidase [Clostridia bacterium]|nr:D-alanyl-D-alanine carboxypeptidase/D-alanyl-D-alanine-endopeptidase [Clostridia bacterium]
MRRARQLVAIYLLLMLVSLEAVAERKSLAKKVDELLEQPEVARAFWGVQVVSLDSGKTLYSKNADKLFIPASNTKLFTTAATLGLIGPDYRFKTTIETTGVVDKYGRLSGDLIIVGRGDPNLSGRTLPYNLRTERKMPPIQVLEQLADQIAARGVKVIDGDIVADDSFFAFERYGGGWAVEDTISEWGAPVSALTINDNLMFVSILPAANPGEKAFVSIQPFPEYYRVDNRVMTTPPGTGPRRIYINREPGSDRLTIYGNIPLDDLGASDALSIEDPADFASKLMYSLLSKRGITIYGRTRTKHTEVASLSTLTVTSIAGGGASREMTPQVPPPLLLATYESQPIAQDLRVINKVSQNLHAELMLRLLGREKGSSGTIDGGLEVVRSFLLQAGIRPEEYALYDGSGLSRQNLVSPQAIVKLLTYVSKQPWADAYIDTLPVGGVDGSLAYRFKDDAAMGRVKAKTGTLGHVNSLAGFATTKKGERVAFAIMANNHVLPNRRAEETIDQIVSMIVDDSRK